MNIKITENFLPKEKFKEIIPNYNYYSTNDTTPYLGPQVKTDKFIINR